MVDPGDEWKTWPEYADWRDPPEGWEAYRTVQAAGVEKGVALSWNGAQYALWRPGWRYDFAPTLAGIAQIMGVDAPRPGYILDQIVTGDARQLAPSLADGSVGLVFCDPVYQNIEDYAWLAEQSLRVLRPRGVCLTWASVPKAGRAQQIMEDAGLEYVYTLFYTVVAKTYRMRWYNLFCWTTPCLWFQRPGEATRPNKWMPDTYRETVILPPEVLDNTVTATANPEDPFAWNKNTGVLRQWMSRFSRPGDVVWDPFAGSGSVPVAAKMLGRRCYASELVAGRADEARARLAATPEPMELSTPASEQAALVFEDAA